MNMKRLFLATGALCVTLIVRPANAHFLWGEVTESTPPVAKIAFSENPGEVSEADLVERIKTARAWNAGGKELKFETAGAVRSAALEGKTFGSQQMYGVLDKTAEGRGVFKLMYYAKSAQTLDGASENTRLPLEFFARHDVASGVLVTLKRGATPFAQTAVSLFEPLADKPRVLTTDAKGELHFEAKTPGLYGLRAAWIDQTPGEQDGKKYPFMRHYTTLTFRVAASTPVTASRPQLVPGPHPNADKIAYELLKNAHDNRQTMPENFPGFSANVTYIKDGIPAQGTIIYRRKGKTEISFPKLSREEYSWVEDKLMNLVGHRRGGDFNLGDGRHPLSLGKHPDNSFGKLIVLNDGMKSEYRVKENKVTEVTREMGGTRFTIAVIETMEADNGKYLANHFLVSYRDAATGNLKMVEGYRDRYSKIDNVWLPTARYVITTNHIAPGQPDTATMQIIRLSDIKILEQSTLAAAP